MANHKVFKYPLIYPKMALPKDNVINIDMPQGAQILTVQVQREQPCIWALVNPAAPMEKRMFHIAGTGHDVGDDLIQMKYIGTFQLYDGGFTHHLFEMV